MDKPDDDTKSLSNEELRQLVDSMISMSTIMKAKKEELKRINTCYKQVSVRVKGHMRLNELKFVDMRGFQVHTYNRIRQSSMNHDFICDGLTQFFQDNKDSMVSIDCTAKAATAFLLKRKKDNVDGTEVWTTTLRNIMKKREKQSRKRKERLLNDDDKTVGGVAIGDNDRPAKSVCRRESSKHRIML
jgi:hypothetical protein